MPKHFILYNYPNTFVVAPRPSGVRCATAVDVQLKHPQGFICLHSTYSQVSAAETLKQAFHYILRSNTMSNTCVSNTSISNLQNIIYNNTSRIPYLLGFVVLMWFPLCFQNLKNGEVMSSPIPVDNPYLPHCYPLHIIRLTHIHIIHI